MPRSLGVSSPPRPARRPTALTSATRPFHQSQTGLPVLVGRAIPNAAGDAAGADTPGVPPAIPTGSSIAREGWFGSTGIMPGMGEGRLRKDDGSRFKDAAGETPFHQSPMPLSSPI